MHLNDTKFVFALQKTAVKVFGRKRRLGGLHGQKEKQARREALFSFKQED